MIQFFNVILFEPLLNILIFLYQTIALGDFGLAIIYLTILIRLLLFPIFTRAAVHQREMQKLQPKLKKLQEQHKNDRAKQAEVMMALYKEHKVNPFTSFFWLLVQLPILIALYWVFSKSLTPDSLSGLYSFVSHPSFIDYSFLGLINLAKSNIYIIGLAALAQYFQARLTLPKKESGTVPSQAEKMSRMMIYIGPLITVLIFSNLPSALGLYWLTTSLFSIGQQIVINHRDHGKLDNLREKNSGVDGL